MTEGRKDDDGKLRMDLLPPEFLEGTAEILTFGAEKYGERNWEKGMAWGRPFGALMRHMWAWWRGEKLDPETGKPHLWHASCCVAFLVAYEARGIGTDDRPDTDKAGHCPDMSGDIDFRLGEVITLGARVEVCGDTGHRYTAVIVNVDHRGVHVVHEPPVPGAIPEIVRASRLRRHEEQQWYRGQHVAVLEEDGASWRGILRFPAGDDHIMRGSWMVEGIEPEDDLLEWVRESRLRPWL